MPGCGDGRCRRAARLRSWTSGAAGAAALLLATPAAAASAWTPIGPEAGAISALAVAPGAPRTLYAVSSLSGVFKTTDGGDSWAPADQGIDLESAYLVTVAAGPDGTLLAGGNGIWRSVDGGASWRQDPPVPLFLPGLQFAFDPRDPRTVHVAAAEGGIYRSTDGGVSWKVELASTGPTPDTPFTSFQTIAVVPGRPEVLLAGSDEALYRSGDGGVSWKRVAAACNVQAVVFDPADPSRIYAGCGGAGPFPSRAGVITSANGGVNWKPTALTALPVTSLAVLPGAAGSVLAATGSGVFRTADGGAHWTRLRGLASVNALAVSPLRHPVLFAGLPGPGVFRSADGGASWTAANRGLTATLATALAADPAGGGRLYIGTDRAGVFSTRDGGASWNALDRGIANPLTWIYGLAVAPLAPSTLYAMAGLTDIFASTDAGQTWSRRSPPGSLGLPFMLCGPVVDPRDPLHVLVGGRDGAIGATNDGGSTWQAHQVMAGTRIVAIAFAPSEPAIVYASGLRDNAQGQGMFKSTDGGATWAPAGPPGFGNTVMAVDPSDPATVYASYYQGVHKTVDGGTTWTLASSIPVGVNALALDPRLPGTVIAATGWPAATGVWISRDGAATWAPLGSGLPSQIGVLGVAFDAASPATLYAATVFGVYELVIPPPPS